MNTAGRHQPHRLGIQIVDEHLKVLTVQRLEEEVLCDSTKLDEQVLVSLNAFLIGGTCKIEYGYGSFAFVAIFKRCLQDPDNT